MPCYLFNTMNYSVRTKLPIIYGQNCTFQAFCCKPNANTTLQLRNPVIMYTTADQSGVGLTFWLVFFFPFLHNSFFFFYKIKTEENSNLHNATLLRRFRFCVGKNSRTFQDRIVEFKDFSRIFGNPGLFKDLQSNTRTFRLCKPCKDVGLKILISAHARVPMW